MRSAAVVLAAAALARAQDSSMPVVIDEGLSTTLYLPPWPTEDTTVAVTLSATVPTDEASSVISSIEEGASSIVSDLTSGADSVTSSLASEATEGASDITSAVDSITSSLESEASSVTSSLASEATDEASDITSEAGSVTSEIGDATTLIPSVTVTTTDANGSEVPTVVVTAAAGKVEHAAPALFGFCLFGLVLI